MLILSGNIFSGWLVLVKGRSGVAWSARARGGGGRGGGDETRGDETRSWEEAVRFGSVRFVSDD